MASDPRPLSAWDQVAPRSYMRQVFCFARDDAAGLDPLREALTAALRRAAEQQPRFAGRVVPGADGTGRVAVACGTGRDCVAVEVLDCRAAPGWAYPDLEAAGFPARAFVGPSFDLPCALEESSASGVPVTVVQARVLRGGLLLCVNVHHSVTDGAGMSSFVAAVAAFTRGLPGPAHGHCADQCGHLPADLASVLPAAQAKSFDDLIRRCPEYHRLPGPTGPLTFRASPTGPHIDSVPKSGRIFVFAPDKIELLKRTARRWKPDKSPVAGRCRYPSTFACLAALTWAHATTARLRPATTRRPDQFRMLLPASWAKRAFADLATRYTGNAVGMVEVKAGLDGLIEASRSSPEALPLTGKALAALVHSIEMSLAGLDQDFVTVRTAMMRAAPDPRLIGVNLDPQDPHDFIVNSWRHLGADIRWAIPGTGRGPVLADAVRRAQSQWNMGAGLIMPGHKDCNKYEILVTLDEVSLKRLCLDPDWTSWVDRIVE